MLWNRKEVEKTKVIRISKQTTPAQITRDQKQLENMEYSKCLGSMITNNATCIHEIKYRITMAKAEFNKAKTLFTSKRKLNLGKKLVKGNI
jgi:hypothetical protein